MFVTGIVRNELFTSLFISSIQMLIEQSGFDFESIKSSISSIFKFGS